MNRTELIFRQPNDSVIFLSIVKDDLVKKKEETGNGGEIQRFRRNPVCPLARPFSFVCFFLQALNVSHSLAIVSLFDKFKSGLTFRLDLRPLFCSNKSREQIACFVQLTSVANTCMFTNRSHVRCYFINTKKLMKKLSRIDISSISVAYSLPTCAVHTRQFELTNMCLSTRTSLPCEGRLKRLLKNNSKCWSQIGFRPLSHYVGEL